MRDDFGKPLTGSDFEYLKPRKLTWYDKAYQHWNGKGPVPKTRKPKAGFDKRLRMVPANILRGSLFFEEEGEVGPRPKNRFSNLKSTWDDYYPDDRCNKSWKYYRKQQWRD